MEIGETDRIVSNHLGDAFWQVSKASVRVFGPEMAIWLSRLYAQRGFLLNEGKLPEDDFFYLKQATIEEDTCIPANKQSSFVKLLTDKGILEVKKRGLPAKNYYRIKTIDLLTYIQQQDKTIKLIGKPKKRQIANENKRLYYKRQLDPAQSKDIYNIKNKKIKSNLLMSKDINSDPKADRYDNSFSSYLPESRELFDYWDSLLNLPHHRLNTTKFTFIMKALDLQVNRFKNSKIPVEEIFEAMYRYDSLFQKDENGTTRYRLSCHGSKAMMGHCVGLDQFFGFDDFIKNIVKAKNNNPFIETLIQKGASWFDECCRGAEYLKKTYGIEETRVIKIEKTPEITPDQKEKYSYIAEKLEKEWLYHDFSEKITDEDRRHFTVAASTFMRFHDANGNRIKWTGTYGHLDRRAAWLVEALGYFGKQGRAEPRWLYSEKTYDETFPAYIEDQDQIEKSLIPYQKWINN